MDPHSFVDGVHIAVYRTAIDGVIKLLRTPPGRSPRPDLVALSTWFNGLDERSAEQVKEVIRLAVDQSVFGLLAVLDGVRAVDNEVTDLILLGDGTPLNAEGDLHDQFRSLVDQELGFD
ncbi:hypothetical protein [Cellulomonas sp. KRMCY2]|uniref:hypothetical protein n=1 Tax=Cellulomonas sp. KRMCY2 TaxID=1304865 RepID=UPI0004B08E77|nr:hypothetical protein [Cellulomonas sp. KRMCY2]